MTNQIPKRVPPPLAQSRVGSDGLRYPVMEPPFIECGATVTLRGIGPVVCVHRKGHPVSLTFGHSNGYEEWCFEESREEHE